MIASAIAIVLAIVLFPYVSELSWLLSLKGNSTNGASRVTPDVGFLENGQKWPVFSLVRQKNRGESVRITGHQRPDRGNPTDSGDVVAIPQNSTPQIPRRMDGNGATR